MPNKPAQTQKKRKKTKSSPLRRIGVWKTVVDADGERQTIYVSVSGDSIQKPQAFRAASTDERYLKSIGVSASGPLSELPPPETVSPYADDWDSDASCLAHWMIPRSVIQAYAREKTTRLYDWQVECLNQCLLDSPPSPSTAAGGANVSQIPSHDLLPSHDSAENDLPQNLTSRPSDFNDDLKYLSQLCGVVEPAVESKSQSGTVGKHPKKTKSMHSLVYCSPTSGGKSLVAEIVMLRFVTAPYAS